MLLHQKLNHLYSIPKKNNVNDIKKTYQILNKTDKNTFPQLARTYIENATNKHLF